MDLSKGAGLQLVMEPCPPDLSISRSDSTPAGQRGTTAGPSADTAGGGLFSETEAAVVPMDPSSPKNELVASRIISWSGLRLL